MISYGNSYELMSTVSHTNAIASSFVFEMLRVTSAKLEDDDAWRGMEQVFFILGCCTSIVSGHTLYAS